MVATMIAEPAASCANSKRCEGIPGPSTQEITVTMMRGTVIRNELAEIAVKVYSVLVFTSHDVGVKSN